MLLRSNGVDVFRINMKQPLSSVFSNCVRYVFVVALLERRAEAVCIRCSHSVQYGKCQQIHKRIRVEHSTK